MVLLTTALALGYGFFATIAFKENAPVRGELALGAAGLSALLSVLGWRQLRLTVLYPLILCLITGLVWTTLVVLSLRAQPIPSSVLSSCGLVLGLALTWYPLRVALRWALAVCLPVAVAGFWASYADPPALVVGGMLLLLIVYITQYNHELIRERATRQHLETLVIRDPLTGLYNRRVPQEQLTQLLGQKGRPEDVAVVLLDLDRFKSINDTFGHRRGDEVLVTVSSVLSQQFPAGTLLCRWGGEEFLIILYGHAVDQARAAVEQVLEAVRRRTDLDGLTFSAGGAMLTETLDLQDLIALADSRLYAAKAAGRDQACWAT
ncbi:diguanylate cyclase (GGDEF) domain-containing protein [Deinococcus hopiensis KR-140]|uniref:Diguanylate cyclase (GGDEF) domain-containing protein n=1 Tax=Deinococcus hopiensis KR-140 TaxID=695939 RepID=A0A1W1UBQ3_9DEIO|nr:diguanylate cyclase (GGDEF) domain-containing protein [Deinococcus hopiensis KR-140]